MEVSERRKGERMTTLEKIRAEIKQAKEDSPIRYEDGLGISLEIIDKYAEQEPCDDAVSRDMALEKMADYVASGYADSADDFEEYSRIICQLPSVRPQEPKPGHWIYTEYHTWCCSECGGNPHKGTGFVPNKDGMKMRWKYCNLCGARMVEPQESEDKG